MIRSTLQAEPVTAHLCELGEGPIWDIKSESIHWLDIENGEIHSFNPVTGKLSTLAIHQRIGCIGFRKGEREWIAGLQNGFATIHRDTGEILLINDPEIHLPGNRFNDGKCDPEGRFWAGTMSLTEEAGAGNLYMLDSNMKASTKIEGVTISNGMAWTEDKTTFYFIDTPTRAITAWAYKYDGTISGKRVIFSIPENEGFPDGMTIDTEGMLWIAHWGGWQVSRWNPATGKKILSVNLPVNRVTSCTFGGQNLDDLYITTARKGMDPFEKKGQPLAGSLFVVKQCGYRGFPVVEFNG